MVSAAALTLPLILSSTVAYAAPAVASSAPESAIEAIRSSQLKTDFQDEHLSQVVPKNIWQNDVNLSHEIGPRLRGMPAEMEAITWAKEIFNLYGLHTKGEASPVAAQIFADVTPSRYTGGYASWQFRPATNGVMTGVGMLVAGDMVDIANATSELTSRNDLAGKVVLAH